MSTLVPPPRRIPRIPLAALTMELEQSARELSEHTRSFTAVNDRLAAYLDGKVQARGDRR